MTAPAPRPALLTQEQDNYDQMYIITNDYTGFTNSPVRVYLQADWVARKRRK